MAALEAGEAAAAAAGVATEDSESDDGKRGGADSDHEGAPLQTWPLTPWRVLRSYTL